MGGCEKMKKIVFLTGTRADFGKLKSLITITNNSEKFEVHIFATGMHMHAKYGLTINEIVKCGYPNIYRFINHTSENSMDQSLAKTIDGFSSYVKEIMPDLIIIHGDRVEALAGAIVGSLNNILVAHVEGGEISGTIDELIRHAVSKMSHIHFVSNDLAKKRLIQMGENSSSIFVIGSPDVDVMLSKNLPDIEKVKSYYDIPFKNFGVLMFHPVTTIFDKMSEYAANIVNVVKNSTQNFVVIYPNNDMGSSAILNEYKHLEGLPNVRMFPSIRFEYFLVLLKNAQFIMGNSSAGIREAPYYGVPTINIGTRQENRSESKDIINCDHLESSMNTAIQKALTTKIEKLSLYGDGNSDQLFFDAISSDTFWNVKHQKQFKDILLNQTLG